jgi:hypothetical protein
LIVEFNAKEFVDWLFMLPSKRLMKPIRAAEAVAVARRLGELANSKPELNFLWRIAEDIWKFLNHVPDGKVATNEQCAVFLADFSPYFPAHDLKTAITVIENAPDIAVPRMSRNPNQVEYRIERPTRFAPAALYGPRTSKRPPVDDISVRIGIAVDAMTEADCSRPTASVADAARRCGLLPSQYCTSPHIISRIKRLAGHTRLSLKEPDIWLMSYWYTKYPEYLSKSVADPEWPERFVFMKCNC